jgi:Tol biopolymer transport system component
MRGDGSGLTELARGEFGRLAVSPDGRRIAFERGGNIHVMDVDGTGVKQLTFDGASSPTWSPNGKRIAYATATGRLFAIGASGDELVPLTSPPDGTSDSSPSWSSDGRRIAFIRRDDGLGMDVWRTNIDGSAVVQLTRPVTSGGALEASWKETPIWSPNSMVIAFADRMTGIVQPSIVLIEDDGAKVRELDHGGEQSIGLTGWSDDGWWILYTRTESGRDDRADIYMMRLDGLTVRLTTDGRSHSPAFVRPFALP